MDVILSVMFYADIVVNFVTEKEVLSLEQMIVERELSKIAVIYLKTTFLFDFVTILPLWECLRGTFNGSHYLLGLKVLRLKRGMGAIDADMYIGIVRDIVMRRVERLVQSKHPDATNRDKDNTFISHIVFTYQALQVVESFVVLVTLGFFMG